MTRVHQDASARSSALVAPDRRRIADVITAVILHGTIEPATQKP